MFCGFLRITVLELLMPKMSHKKLKILMIALILLSLLYIYLYNPNKFRCSTLREKLDIEHPRTPTNILPFCPEEPDNLAPSVDPLRRLEDLRNHNSVLKTVSPGGTYKPPDCQAREHVAILVSFRDRDEHLRDFLLYMHAFLQKQKVQYTIFIVEMTYGTTFNTGLLHNAGFILADKTDNFTCFFIHDVDLLPVNETNLYRCAEVPTHFCHINSKYEMDTVFYPRYFGGVQAVTREQYVRANGYSNLYFGWGREDDDFLRRLELVGYTNWTRVPKEIGFYYSMPHDTDKGNAQNDYKDNLRDHCDERMKYEGLNSPKYTLLAVELRPLYTWILVDVNREEVLKNYSSLLV